MNIQTLNECIQSYRELVVESGFKRDLDDYSSSLSSAQGNVLALREMAESIRNRLAIIYSSDLPQQLLLLLPKDEPRPFTETPHDKNLQLLLDDT